MKKIIVLALAALCGCQTMVTPDQYIANMYAKGTLKGYGNNVGSSETCSGASCPGCHVQHFDRARLIVEEVLTHPESGKKHVEACHVTVTDSLGLMNITETRYIPATETYGCEVVYEKEKSYLTAMGFQE